jgi:WD40 repeat protein
MFSFLLLLLLYWLRYASSRALLCRLTIRLVPYTTLQIHQLAGHLHKVTSVRILNNNQNVLTCSADRSMKLWDISKQTYRQSTTMSFNSFASSIDVVSDGRSAISGHVDGSLLFWDLETAQKTAEIKGTACCAVRLSRKRILLTG